jgi:Holliday junction resolvase RusA-like endonuclease
MSGKVFSNAMNAVIPGPPASWQRPRRGEGGKGSFTTSTMRKAKAHARAALAAAALQWRWEPATGPVRLTLVFVRNRKPDAVPDVDNYSKLVCDSANGVLWQDDALVVELHAVKRRPGEGEAECTIVCVERMEP